MREQTLIEIINSEMGLDLPLHMAFEEVRLKLQAAINHMIETDFQQLVSILYRVDVNERKLKYLLQENVGEDASAIIAGLIIERQMEKIASRKQSGRRDDNISEADKW